MVARVYGPVSRKRSPRGVAGLRHAQHQHQRLHQSVAARVAYAFRMQIPMVVKERTVRVQASIPVSQGDALKALAAASGVPLARAVQYAVERLLDVARREGALAVTGGLAPPNEVGAGGDSVAEVADALELRVPAPDPGSREAVGRNGEPTLALPVAQEGEQVGEHRAGQESGQPDEQQREPPPARSAEHPSEHEARPVVEQAGDAPPAALAEQPGEAAPDSGADAAVRAGA